MTVSRRQARVPVSFEYADESDRGRYPVPRNCADRGWAPVGRRPARDRGRPRPLPVYELFAAYPREGDRRWRAGSGATWDLRSNRLRSAGWTSADAAGLPILPGLARYDEVRRGRIDHALRFTVPQTRRPYVYPARHFASSSSDPAAIPTCRPWASASGSRAASTSPGRRLSDRDFEAVDTTSLPRPGR